MTTEELLCAVTGNVILEVSTSHHEGRGEYSTDKWTMSTIHGGKKIIEILKRSPTIDYDKVLSSNCEVGEPRDGFTVVRSLVPPVKQGKT